MPAPFHPRTTLPFAVAPVALAIGIAAPLAQATTLTASAEYQIFDDAGEIVKSDSFTSSSQTNAFASRFATEVTGEASATSSANDSGFLYTIASGGGRFSSEGEVRSAQSFTNDSGIEQQYFFDFTIVFGSLSNTVNTALSGDEELVSGYGVSIYFTLGEQSPSSLWNSAAMLRTDESGSNLTTSGTLLGNYEPEAANYFWSTFSDTLDLGLVAPGQSFALEYWATAYATGDTGVDSNCSPGGEPAIAALSEVAPAVVAPGSCFGGNAFANFGDPFNLNEPMLFDVRGQPPVASVPEPNILALAAAGLVGLAVARLRTRRRKT